MPQDARAKHRTSPEELEAARRTVQWWEPTGREVCSERLSAEDFAELQSTILQTSIMDSEVANLMLRRPTVFCAEMLPSLASQTTTGAAMAAEAQAASSALRTAAAARFELFTVDYFSDVQAMQSFSVGGHQPPRLPLLEVHGSQAQRGQAGERSGAGAHG